MRDLGRTGHHTRDVPSVAAVVCLGGTFSGRVPRSSAEVRKVLVYHILEVEVVRQ